MDVWRFVLKLQYVRQDIRPSAHETRETL